MPDDGRWLEIGDGIHARRYAELDLTVGLVIGEGECLVIDTRGDVIQGAEFAAAVQELTPHRQTIVYTHAHFDHCYGTAAFVTAGFDPPVIWAHRRCRAAMIEDEDRTKRVRARDYRAQGRDADAADLESTELILPGEFVDDRVDLTVGGRRVTLAHFGSAHSGHDLVVHLPDDSVTFAGDLVEHLPGGSLSPDSFGPDTDLAGWPTALDGVLGLGARTVVPGHGEPVDADFLAAQRETLTELVAIDTAVRAGEITREEAVRRSPLPSEVTLAALDRMN